MGNERKIHWRSWSKLTESKEIGGMSFRDLRSFNLAMLAKQGWRLIQEHDSLMYQCFKARYFPRSQFLEALDSPNSSYVWKSIMTAKPILKKGCCWRVGDGVEIKVISDKWIPNHPTNGVVHPPDEIGRDWHVSELIDPDLKWWRRDLILAHFHKDDAEAILRLPLSYRHVPNAIVWLHNKKGVYSVKSGYHVARRVFKTEDWVESSAGPIGCQVWPKLWKLHVPNKIKVFVCRACHNILPTCENLWRSKIVEKDGCVLCSRETETGVHALWECAIAKDVWSGSMIKIQKCSQGQQVVLHLFQELLGKLSTAEFELFVVQAWIIWNQRNTVVFGGKLKDPKWLNKRAKEFLDEFHQAQGQLRIPVSPPGDSVWHPPLDSSFKLNFDAAVFSELNCLGVGAMIRNEKGKVMAAMSARGPHVIDSIAAEVIACRRALEFACEAGFTDLVVEGDNLSVMKLLAASEPDHSWLGHIIQDIKWLTRSLRMVSFSYVRRAANSVAHGLARYAKYVHEDMYWIDDNPPPVLEALYYDYSQLNE